MSLREYLLKCDSCANGFDNVSHNAIIIVNCGHIFCNLCISYRSQNESLFNCIYRCDQNSNEQHMVVLPHRQFISADNLLAKPMLGNLSYLCETGLTINPFCTIHEKSIIGYDGIDKVFKCPNCQQPELSPLLSLKEFTSLYYKHISHVISLYNLNQAKLKEIDNLKDKFSSRKINIDLTAIDKFSTYIKSALRRKDISEEQFTKFDYVRKNYLDKIEKHFNIIEVFCNDYQTSITNLTHNNLQCKFIEENAYEFDKLPCEGIQLYPYKPVEYFLNKDSTVEDYVQKQIIKFNRKFIARFYKISQTISHSLKFDKNAKSFLSESILAELNDSFIENIKTKPGTSVENNTSSIKKVNKKRIRKNGK